MKEMEVSTARTHKDRVFRMLYEDRNNLLELYNALNGTDYQNQDDLEITTLENAIYISMKNDVSFLLGNELNLFEHQSTYNSNMPLRDLFYVARQLEVLVKDESLYQSGLVMIPVPRFVVFYNGTEERPESEVLSLSDSFQQKTDDPELELKVTMLNINYGCNRELMEKCSSLSGYSQFVKKIREYRKSSKTIGEAVESAVEYCINADILRVFLTEQKARVIAMSIFEHEEEKIWQKIRESEYRNGEEKGRADGLAEGKVEGKAESLLTVLSCRGNISESLHDKIMAENDEGMIQRWLILALTVKTVEEFCEQM